MRLAYKNISFILLLSFFVLLQDLNAQIWHRIGGPGGQALDFAKSYSNLFLISSESIYRSSNNGLYWDRLPYLDNVAGQGLKDIESNGNVLFLAEANGSSISYDQGNTWDTIPNSPILCVDVAFDSLQVCIFGMQKTMYSPDNGTTWTELLPGNNNYPTAGDIEGPMIALSTSSYFFISTDTGATFTPYLTTTATISNTLYIKNGIILSGSNAGLHISTDTGAVWNLVTDISNTCQVLDIYEDGPNLYLASSVGTYHSVNNGLNWTRLDSIGSPAVFSSNGLLITNRNWVSRSTDGGVSWDYSANGISETTQIDIEIDGPGMFTSSGYDIFYSGDDGINWEPRSNGIDQKSALDFVSLGRYTFASNSDGVFRTEDHGLTWTNTSVGLPAGTVDEMLVYNSLIFAACSSATGILFVSADSGNTWTNSDNGLPMTYIRSIAKHNQDLFCSVSNNRVYKSIDAGQSWTSLNNFLPVYVNQIVSNDDMLVCSGNISRTVYFSFDDGATWDSSVVNYVNSPVNRIQFINGRLMITCTNVGIYITNDTGLTWINAIYDLADYNRDVPNDLYSKGNYIFSTTRRSGIWRTDTTDIFISVPSIANNSTLFIYPNPVFNQFSLQIPERFNEIKQIRIFNSAGMLVKEVDDNISSGVSEKLFDVTTLSSGIYFLQMISDNGNLVTRFVKQ
jgi:photosystem II stability/assembly factor-like uncharacterized protein